MMFGVLIYRLYLKDDRRDLREIKHEVNVNVLYVRNCAETASGSGPLVGVEIGVDLVHTLLLDADRGDEANAEESDEAPEDVVSFNVASIRHHLLLAGPVTGEEHSPRADEQVAANE